jgi:hypothetical protein
VFEPLGGSPGVPLGDDHGLHADFFDVAVDGGLAVAAVECWGVRPKRLRMRLIAGAGWSASAGLPTLTS